ncbi:MAG: hypothetical protein ABIS03_01020, partial [Gemmatimonadaceae bacterium]
QSTGMQTQVGLTLGTPAYMSPEQAAGDEIDGRSDLYSLGCVVYEMLSGEAPFTGTSAAAIIAKRFAHTPPSVATLRTDVPPAIAALVERLLSLDPVGRPDTGASVSETLRAPSAPALAVARHADAAPNSIAVLPFVNMSADSESEYFTDGLTEEIITDLSRVHALRVTSRASSMQNKGSTQELRNIALLLGVRYLLTGSVRRAGSALRIAAQLVDANEDHQLWGHTFSGTMDDVFDVQERVSREIVAALGIKLNPNEDRALAARGIRNAEAYALYLRARAEMWSLPPAPERWRALLDRATDIEGDVPALRGLRLWGEVSLMKLGVGDPARLPGIEHEAKALVALDQDQPRGYAVLGYAAIERGDMAEGILRLRDALKRDPTDSDSLYWLMAAYAYAGLLPEAEATGAELLVRDPLSPLSWVAGTAARFFGGRIDSTIADLDRAIAVEPNHFGARWQLAYSHCALGTLDEAQRHVDWMLAVAPDVPYVVQADALLQVVRGTNTEGLARVHALDLTGHDAHLLFHIAEVYAMAGDVDRGLQIFALAVHGGFTVVSFFTTHCPFLAPLRGHPRFASIVAEAMARQDAVRRRVAPTPEVRAV